MQPHMGPVRVISVMHDADSVGMATRHNKKRRLSSIYSKSALHLRYVKCPWHLVACLLMTGLRSPNSFQPSMHVALRDLICFHSNFQTTIAMIL